MVEIEDMKFFIDDQALTARIVKKHLSDYGPTDVDGLIKFISLDGFKGNAKACNIAYTVYRRYLATEKSTPETIIFDLVDYYHDLARTLRKAGVKY